MKNVENKKKRELEVYIHIPFCVKKCAYCDFLSGPAGKAEQELYVETLLKEIASFGRGNKWKAGSFAEESAEAYEVVSVFFGGGTPSILEPEKIGQILKSLREKFVFRDDAEISIECNPGTADREKLQQYRSLGINRISFGLQSADNQELKLLGRIHTWEYFLETYQEARAAGFLNINVDLMSALPGQSVSTWEQTLEKVLALEPEHISAYSLIIEEGTPFYDQYAEDARLREDGEVPQFLPSEEEERKMYQLTEEQLLDTGMYRYEISNYAKKGYECRHNIGYWTGTEYVGFGLGAASYLKNHKDSTVARSQNTTEMEQYLKEDFAVQAEVLTESDQMSEFMFLGLRMMTGVSEEEFKQRFNKEMETVYGAAISRQCELGLLKRANGRIFLSETGINFSNTVMAEFLI